MPNKYYLHEAMQIILSDQPGKMATPEEILEQIYLRNLYRQKNGKGDFPPSNQIQARANNMPKLFRKEEGRNIKLIGPILREN
jgi:hypothetical protein